MIPLQGELSPTLPARQLADIQYIVGELEIDALIWANPAPTPPNCTGKTGEALKQCLCEAGTCTDLLYFFHSDHIGSSTFLTDFSGQPYEFILYLPYGEILVNQKVGPYETPYKFTGKESDPETELTYFGARYYDAALGIWLGVDPLAEKFPYLTPFHYVINNPVRMVDPNGMEVDDIIDIDKKTGRIKVTAAKGADVVRLVNNGKVENSYIYGANGSFNSENIIEQDKSGTTLTSAQIIPGSADKAQTFFEFASKSDVEYGKLDILSPSGEKISVVTTSHEPEVTSTLPGLVIDYSKRGFTGVKQSHSHPGTITHYNESVPSGHYKNERGNPLSLMPFTVNGKKVGDAANGIWVKSKKGFSNTLFEVHAPGNKTITTYDGINRAKIRNN